MRAQTNALTGKVALLVFSILLCFVLFFSIKFTSVYFYLCKKTN